MHPSYDDIATTEKLIVGLVTKPRMNIFSQNPVFSMARIMSPMQWVTKPRMLYPMKSYFFCDVEKLV